MAWIKRAAAVARLPLHPVRHARAEASLRCAVPQPQRRAGRVEQRQLVWLRAGSHEVMQHQMPEFVRERRAEADLTPRILGERPRDEHPRARVAIECGDAFHLDARYGQGREVPRTGRNRP